MLGKVDQWPSVQHLRGYLFDSFARRFAGGFGMSVVGFGAMPFELVVGSDSPPQPAMQRANMQRVDSTMSFRIEGLSLVRNQVGIEKAAAIAGQQRPEDLDGWVG